MNNYEFCAEFAAKRGRLVLDYGCGQGQIVELLLGRGVDTYGCDVFYEGGDYSPQIPNAIASRIKRMEGDRIPFPDQFFDVVTHNQVFEHVPDLNVAVAEIARVLKPGGVMLGLFPDSNVWREGHCGIPFLHWFPKGSNVRVYYALALRAVGLGLHHGEKSRRAWAEDFCLWLDNWTYYRTYRDITASLQKHFSAPVHIEAEWFGKRVGAKAALVPPAARRFITRRWGGMVFWCQRH